MKSRVWMVLFAALAASAAPASAQSDDPLTAIQQRLDALEQQNTDLRNEVRVLREAFDKLRAPTAAPAEPSRVDALEEKVALHDARLADQDAVKAESSQRVPIRLTGVILFNAFANSRQANPARDDPYYAAANAAATPNVGGSLRQSLFGVDFHTPEAVLGGEVRGSALFDIFALSNSGGSDSVAVQTNTSPRLRTAWIEGRWGNRSVLAGLANTVLSPREPNSLAQVFLPPLSGAGNLYGWRQQIRFEQRAPLAGGREVVGQVALVQTVEDWPKVQAAFASSLESKRPALEAHAGFSQPIDDTRRIEIGAAYHLSSTHVAGLSIPSRIYSVDWLITPIDRVSLSGMFFNGENVGNAAGRNAYGFSILTPSPGVVRAIAVRTYGAWTQVAVQAAPRLKLHVYSGIEDPNDADTIGSDGVIRNTVGAANTFFQLAPNVITGVEVSQTRTWYKAGQRPRLTHYDLYVAYVF